MSVRNERRRRSWKQILEYIGISIFVLILVSGIMYNIYKAYYSHDAVMYSKLKERMIRGDPSITSSDQALFATLGRELYDR